MARSRQHHKRVHQTQRQKTQDVEAQKISSLTAREREVIEALVKERSAHNRTIAEHLNISDHTLRNHSSSIYDKLGLENRMDLYLYATDHGLASGAAKG